MAFVKVSVLLMLIFSLICAQDIPSETSILPSSTTEATTTTDSTSTTPSTVPPVTTKSTSTTQPPPPPTTSSTTTTTTTPSTTQPPPTTNVPPSPTPKPNPLPPDFNKWSYTDPKTNQTCVIVQFALQVNLTYQTVDDQTANVLYNVPANTTNVSGGLCGNTSQSISLKWGRIPNESKMTLDFKLNETTSEFTLSMITLTIDAVGEFNDSKADQTINLYHNRAEFTTPIDFSYVCHKIQTIGFSKVQSGTDIITNGTVSHLQLEAFHKQNADQFATGRDCEEIDTPDIVPIAVGCALAGLVIIVLIAYLIGRRRAQARGYLSM